MKYLVKYEKIEQVSDVDFAKYWVEGLFEDDTTIAEIKQLVKSKYRYYENKEFNLFEVRLSEPEQKGGK